MGHEGSICKEIHKLYRVYIHQMMVCERGGRGERGGGRRERGQERERGEKREGDGRERGERGEGGRETGEERDVTQS